MIQFYGLPITPATAAVQAIAGGDAFVSFAHPHQLGIALEVCRSVAFDNGAWSAFAQGRTVESWQPYYKWIDELQRHPTFAFAVIPDVIDGDEDANDRLVEQWPLGRDAGAPVWHMHESLERLSALCTKWPRVCIGSSGQFTKVGDKKWWLRMTDAMNAVCDKRGYPIAKLHGLRMLNPAVFTKLPLASADSSNIGRSVGIDDKWKNAAYAPPTKEARALIIRMRTQFFNGAQRWDEEL